MSVPTPTKLAELRQAIGHIMVKKTPRKGFTPKQRRMVWDASDGLCCGCDEPLTPGWHVDHRKPLADEGEHAPANWQALCPSCHIGKTRHEATVRAKTERLRKADTEPRQPSRLQSRGFQTGGPKRPWPSRPFPKDNRKARKVMA